MADNTSSTNIVVEALKFYPEEVASKNVQAQITSLWEAERRFIILSGPPGVGKTRAAEDFIFEMLNQHQATNDQESCRVTTLFPDFKVKLYDDHEIEVELRTKGIGFVWDICVLHPQYSYEDLIRGFRMSPGSNSPQLDVREGILGFTARVAQVMGKIHPGSKYPLATLIMDEINRAPIGQLFGEALYALDRRGKSVATPYDLGSLGSTMTIPKTLLIIGTMNSVDRAISGFDFALRRRFVSLQIASDRNAIEKRFENLGAGVGRSALVLYDKIKALVMNSKKTGIVTKSELVIGHAFFLPPATLKDSEPVLNWLSQSYQFQILPTLIDYQEQGLIEFTPEDVGHIPLASVLNGDTTLESVRNQDLLQAIKALGVEMESVGVEAAT